MKSDFSRRFYGQVLVNILYSTMVACLVEIFLIANVDMIVNYLEKTQGSLSPALKIFRMGTATTILYVIAGIGIFSLTFLLLQRKSIRYIGKIAAAIQNISEGDLNIQVEVEGDDEFAMMAASLNRMEADIRELMDKERESERTKNELMHGMLNMDGANKFHFNWKDLVPSGLSVKDAIAPTALAFKNSRTFQMGGIFGAVSFLNITASDLSDQLLKDFLDMDSSQIVTMHIQSVDQNKAIKTIKHTITELDRSKIEEQKKAVRAGYDMDVRATRS